MGMVAALAATPGPWGLVSALLLAAALVAKLESKREGGGARWMGDRLRLPLLLLQLLLLLPLLLSGPAGECARRA